MKRILLLAILMTCAGVAHAQLGTKNLGGSDDAGDKSAASASSVIVDSHKFYVGTDYSWSRFSVSDPGSVNNIPVNDYDASFLDVRAGYRVFSAVAVEAHYGVPLEDASNSAGRLRDDKYYSGFVVPTATVLSAFELSVPIGYTYSQLTYKASDGSGHHADLHSISYGANIEVPVREFWDKFPDIRLTSGALVYYRRDGARYYGFHTGLRFDFGF